MARATSSVARIIFFFIIIIIIDMRILVTGATGFVGSLLAPRLLSEGHAVRALTRQPIEAASGRGHLMEARSEIEIFQGDALSGEGLARALDGVEVAYYLIHSMERSPAGASPSPSGESTFSERERIAADTFAAASARAGVRRIVYLGGLMPQGPATVSRHLASREEVERILLTAVPDSVALRASIVIGARSRSFRFLVHLVERLPVLTLPAWRRFATQPIDARDVIEMLTAAALAPTVGGQSLDVGGGEVLTYGEMIARIADLMLVNRPALGFGVSVTPLVARVAAAIAQEDPGLILPLMESLETDLLPADDRAAEKLGVHLHSFDSAVEHALGEWEEIEPLTARGAGAGGRHGKDLSQIGDMECPPTPS
jgi:uncharacterized protein YbjT (DUF2867 family)